MLPLRQSAVRGIAATALLAAAALGGCKRHPAPQPQPAPFVLDDALQHWYGRYDQATQTARANLPEHPTVDLAGSDFAANDPVDITAIFDEGYTQAGHPRHVVVTAAVPHRSDKPGRPGDELFHCLQCRPVIGMAVFTLRNNTWLLENENLAADLAGSNGRAPDVHLMTVGTDLHSILLESQTETLDDSTRHVSLLVPWHEGVALAFTAETASSNRGACGPESPLRDPCYAWQRAISFAAVPGQEYDDLVLTASGTQLPPEQAPAPETRPARAHGRPIPQPPAPEPQAVPFTSVERLRFREGRYVPLESESPGGR